MSPPPVGRRIAVHGTVQGVGFRPWVYRLARSLGVAGSAYGTVLTVMSLRLSPPFSRRTWRQSSI